jgi:MATE family multidrug resistance protein
MIDEVKTGPGGLRPGGYRETLRVALPLIVGMASFTLMQFTDRLFLAWYDDIAIQAALPAGILSFTLICLFMSLAGYAGTFVSQYHGAGDAAGCSRATAQGLWVSLLSWPAMLALIPFGRMILRLSGHPPAVLEAELTYFTILMIGSLSIPLGAAVSGFFTGRGDTMTNMWATVAANVVNLVLDYALIFGAWGLPRMGIAGAAIATAIAGAVQPALLLWIYLGRGLHATHGTRTHWRPDLRLMGRLVRFGLPSGLQIFSDVGSFALFVLLTGRLGGPALAASNIAFSINNLAFMPLLGMGTAASILVGQYQGGRRSDLAERAGWTSLKVAWIYMAVIGASFVLLPEAYFALFGARRGGVDAAALVPLGRWMLLMMAGWGLLDTINLVLSGALKGAGDTRFVMIYFAVMAWLFWLPGEFVILWAGGGILAAWFWLMVYVIVLSLGFLWRWRGGRWKAIEMIERPVTPLVLPPPHAGAEALLTGE